jgi:hypothetical protein
VPTILAMTTSVLLAAGAITQQVGATKDYISVTYGDSSGTQYCSARSYSITSSINSLATVNLDVTSLSIDVNTGLISVQSSDFSQIGTHTATVTVSLSSYTSVPSITSTFQITILPCAVTSVQVV